MEEAPDDDKDDNLAVEEEDEDGVDEDEVDDGRPCLLHVLVIFFSGMLPSPCHC